MKPEAKTNKNYDAHITPAETAAREEREGENFKKTPEPEKELDTTAGYTVDKEGLLNNYAIEPEMYYEEPGDRREIEEAEKAERAQELKEINEEGGQGRKGQGII
ncbi:hypothetical protein NIES593_19175 [Hydrococcus rivularis NIES-593]|uniref:Uncharacterized protein n=1 Tax=Hydrococcus rivularis NIES-593 TaxID=1921803 RepID=A0A1U7H9Y0_9CYAN|nr:hypothetical protein [Hydrococcus rivularis]OKH20348.1 hypothetical protein NIES593_19175 [Hydrococcus rivularis NIES-593]